MAKQKHPAISVAAKQETFRRAGHVFGRHAKTIPLAALHPDAYRAITEDQSLVVVHTATELDEAEAQALPHHDATHVTTALASAETLTLQVGEDDAKRALALADIEADLTAREAALALAEADLKRSVDAFDERYAGLVSREKELTEREHQLNERQAAIEAAEKAASGTKHGSQGRKS